MASGQGDIPALESGLSSGLCGALSSPIGMTRHNISYDELIDAPMHSPPPDTSMNFLWKDPIIPHHRFRNTAEVTESGDKLLAQEAQMQHKSAVSVVKAKASTFMSSLMIKQTQENIERFEHQAGLTETVYSPHKGLSAEETRVHRLVDGKLPKLRMPSGDFKEDRLTTSAHSTPSVTPSGTPTVTPHSSPAVNRRNWLQLSSAPCHTISEPEGLNLNADMGGNEGGGGGGGLDRWSLFGTRSVVHKSPTDPGSETSTGFSLQSYFGLQKSSTMDGTNTQINLKVEDPAKFTPPKIEISVAETKQVSQRLHKLKPRDMNVLTPSGF